MDNEIWNEKIQPEKEDINRTSIKRQVVHRGKVKMPRNYGWLGNPKKYGYNKVYKRTSFDLFKLLKRIFK